MQSFTVRAYECSPEGRLSLRSLFHFFEEAAWNSSHELGFSIDHLNKADQSWVLHRLDAHIYELPAHRQSIKFDTWPSGADRFFAYRDFKIFDSKTEKLLAEGASSWLIFNVHTRKLEPIPSELIGDAYFEDKANLPRPNRKLPTPASWEEAGHIQIRKQDLDRNNHVNNVALIQFMLEQLPEGVNERDVQTIEVLFKTELLPGEAINAQKMREDEWLHVQLLKQPNSQLVASGRIKCF